MPFRLSVLLVFPMADTHTTQDNANVNLLQLKSTQKVHLVYAEFVRDLKGKSL